MTARGRREWQNEHEKENGALHYPLRGEKKKEENKEMKDGRERGGGRVRGR